MKLPEFLVSPDPRIYLENQYCVCDFENSNLDKGSALRRDNRIVLATWHEVGKYLGSGDFKNSKQETDAQSKRALGDHIESKFGNEYHQEELLRAIGRSKFIVAHHAKHELQWLARCGLEIGSILIFDTMLAEFVLAGNRRWRLSLKQTARRYGLQGKESKVRLLIEGGVCPSEIPESWLLEYCAGDTDLCHRIFLLQRQRLADAGLLPVMFTRCLLTPILADIEMQGVQLDPKRVKEEYEKTSNQLGAISERLSKFSSGINWRSSQQVAGLLYSTLGFEELRKGSKVDRTEGGKPRTDSGTIERLKAGDSDQREFIAAFKEFKKLEKRFQNLEKLKACCEVDNGRLYAQYNQAVAGTHRLTSSGLKHKAQFQNIDHTLKSLFKARNPGWLVGEADGVQLEFRVAAHLGRDQVALADIRDPTFDVHWQTAEQIYGRSRTELRKEVERYDSKPRTFRPLYGATSGSPAERRYIKFFQERYKAIYETQTQWTYTVLKEKKLRTETGLIFYWPDTEIEVSESNGGGGYIRNRTAIFNYPVQSLATADIIPIALVYLWHRIKALGLKLFLVNTIHDSVIAEVPPDELDQFSDLIRRSFTLDCFDYLDKCYNIHYTVPLGVSWKVGQAWSLGEEHVYNLDPDEYHREQSRRERSTKGIGSC